MKTAIVLAMHGQPPNDFPHRELMEFFLHHAASDQDRAVEIPEEKKRHDELNKKIKSWPRTPQNDPYYFSSLEIASELERIMGYRVFIGFNEFCTPDLENSLLSAVESGADRILVITPMMTRGGDHSEKDIPAAIRSIQNRYPEIPIIFAWPFQNQHIALHLASQARRFLD